MLDERDDLLLDEIEELRRMARIGRSAVGRRVGHRRVVPATKLPVIRVFAGIAESDQDELGGRLVEDQVRVNRSDQRSVPIPVTATPRFAAISSNTFK